MKRLLVTGVSGFIGRLLCEHLSLDNDILGTFYKNRPSVSGGLNMEQVDLSNTDNMSDICKKYKPDVVIHCAAIAHQKIASIDRDSYFCINSQATYNLAQAAAISNPDVLFIFLSSISVYGESNLTLPVTEDHDLNPTGDYGLSKLDAERRLVGLMEKRSLRNLIILRLAPVYDREWHFNLDRRVLFPKNLFYMKFGSGEQKMSALARPNLVDLIKHIIDRHAVKQPLPTILNVCDGHPYAFENIIQIFKQSPVCPNRPIFRIPLFPVYLTTRIAGIIFRQQQKWFHAAYEKLASSLIFDNRKMLDTGFKPKYSLESIFLGNGE